MLRLSVCAVAGLLFVACCLSVAADKDEEKELQGKIKKVDADKREITVTTKDGKDEQFEVVKDSKINIGDKEAKLGDLKEGLSVTLIIKANGRGRVIEIRVKKDDK
jgi:Cu/Ag efflux protein CusF